MRGFLKHEILTLGGVLILRGPMGRLALRSGDDEVLGDDDHFIIPRRLSSPAGDDRGMMIHFCVILYHPPVSSPRVR